MNLDLRRRPGSDGVILGELSIDGFFECFTLEDVEFVIPVGRYRITITPSRRFGRMLPLVNDVPGRTGIRIHAGNTSADTEGCILVGQHEAGLTVGHSRDAMAQLQPKLAAALAHHQDVWLTITEAATSTSPMNA